MLLNATVAEAIGELTDATPHGTEDTRRRATTPCSRWCARRSRRPTAVRFEGNNYSDEWVKEAKKRGLPNFRRTPEALAQMVTKPSRELFMKLGILSKEELDSRYHVRLERYVKDMLIEMHTLAEMANTMVLPAGYAYCAAPSRRRPRRPRRPACAGAADGTPRTTRGAT